MKRGYRIALVAAGLVFTLVQRSSWAAPPNPTASDAGDNTAGGADALVDTIPNTMNHTGIRNTAFGAKALTTNTIGRDNSAFGAFVLQSNSEGSLNIGIGLGALFLNTAGNSNIAVGALDRKSVV